MKIHLITDYDSKLLCRVLSKDFLATDSLFASDCEVSANNYHNFNLDFEVGFSIPTGTDYTFFDFSLLTIVNDHDEFYADLNYFKGRMNDVLSALLCHIKKLSKKSQELVIFEPRESISSPKHCFSRGSGFYCERYLLSWFFNKLQEYCGDIENLSFLYRQHISTSLRSSLVMDTPFDHNSIKSQSKLMLNLIATISKPKVKVICVDLDNTLWGGEVGEVGTSALELGGITGRGRAFRLVQVILKRLSDRGILLAVVSKNTENLALEAIRTHPEMVLREKDFISTKIGWQSKAVSIYELSRDLRLGVDSFLFLDDSAQEREEVQSSMPGIFSPVFDSPYDLIELLLTFPLLNATNVTEEDLSRLSSYRENSAREQFLVCYSAQGESLAELLKSSIIPVRVKDNLPRCLQLLNKTNQFNAISRRYSEREIKYEVTEGGRNFFAFRGSDKFGDYGLISVICVNKVSGGFYRIEDWVLSCRAIGKGMEEGIIRFLVSHFSVTELEVLISVTDRNLPIIEFYEKYGLLVNGRPVRIATRSLLVGLEGNCASVSELLTSGI